MHLNLLSFAAVRQEFFQSEGFMHPYSRTGAAGR